MTFLTVDDPEHSFSLHEAATQVGTIIGALAAKSIMQVAPSTVPVSVVRPRVPIALDLITPRTLLGVSQLVLPLSFGRRMISPGIRS